MKAIEFDKIEGAYNDIEQHTIQMCIENNVDFYDYLGTFVKYRLFNYRESKALIDVIKNLDFSDKIHTRAVLNKRDFWTKEWELKEAIAVFNEHENNLFKWLDATKDPHFFILNPVYNYGAGYPYSSWVSNIYGYLKNPRTGSVNIDISIDYIKYRLKGRNLNNA